MSGGVAPPAATVRILPWLPSVTKLYEDVGSNHISGRKLLDGLAEGLLIPVTESLTNDFFEKSVKLHWINSLKHAGLVREIQPPPAPGYDRNKYHYTRTSDQPQDV